MAVKKRKPIKIVVDKTPFNVSPEGMVGCHIVRVNTPWVIGTDAGDEELMDISIDPYEGVLTINNPTDKWRTIYCSFPYEAADKNGKLLAMSETVNEKGEKTKCITFCCVLPARTLIDVCELNVPPIEDEETYFLDVRSDVIDLDEEPQEGETKKVQPPRAVVMFPFKGEHLCTQGNGGNFTHIYTGNCFAYDLRAEVGTDLLAVADGEVVDVNDGNSVTGVCVTNLFKWNSMMIKLDKTEEGTNNPLFVEYVHIMHGSCTVKKGDKVAKGDVICKAGGVGFCPEPHLHIQMHASSDEKAPSIPFAFAPEEAGLEGAPFRCEAGKVYGPGGLVAAKK